MRYLLILVAACSLHAQAFPAITPSAALNLRVICNNNYIFGQDATGSVGTDLAVTSRKQCTTVGPVTRLSLVIHNQWGVSSTETAVPNAVVQRASIEYGGAIISRLTVSGQSIWTIDPQSPGLITDTTGVFLPAGATFYVLFYERVPGPPTIAGSPFSPSAGGTLPAGTYYYRISTVDIGGLESAWSSEQTCTTASTNLSCPLTWTPVANMTATAYSIYRSTSTGAETLVAQIPGTSTGWTDQGTGDLTSTKVAPTQPVILYTQHTLSGDSTQGHGINADLTGTPGAISANVGPKNAFGSWPYFLIGDDLANKATMAFGDSIPAGVGPVASFNLASGSQPGTSWTQQGFPVGFNFLNASLGGTIANQILTNAVNARNRFAAANYVDNIVTNLGTNDLAVGRTWQQVAGDLITLGAQMHALNKKFYAATLVPRVTSTDQGLTVANQTQTAWESQRQNLNTWFRNGMQISAGAPCNTASCGSRTPAIDNYFDASAAIEVNSSNVLTPNGGFWQVFPTPTVAVLTLNGTPTTTAFAMASSSLTGGTLSGSVVVMTSGAASGQIAVIQQVNNPTSISLYANGALGVTGLPFVGLTTAPSAGDTFKIMSVPFLDGTHPSFVGHNVIGAAFAPWVTANIQVR